MSTYRCFGLTLRSAIELPEVERGDPGLPVDVTIVESRVDPRPPDAVEALPGLWRAADQVWLEVPRVGRFQVSAGTRIAVERDRGVPDGDVRIFLLGTALGAVLWQRDHLVLHGNAFRRDGSAVVVVGHSGAGKSTLAAELARRDLAVLSDDVVPVDSSGRALPGYPRVKLWADALTSLGWGREGLERITAAHEKFHVPIRRELLDPLPVSAIYVLERHAGDRLELEPLRGADCFDALRTHTYRRELAVDPAASRRHLEQCAAVARRARIVRVHRPAATMTAAATADAILTDVDTHPTPAVVTLEESR